MDPLIERARCGDADAFARLFESEKLALWRSIRAILGNDHDAADALQETALRAWKALPQFSGACSFGTWAMRIALNASYDVLRRMNREQACDFGALATGSVGSRGLSDAAAERLTSQWEPASSASIDVQRTLCRLSSEDRLVLMLFYVNDIPCAQVAEILGISEGAVRTRLTRARARFRKAYGGDALGAQQTSGGKEAPPRRDLGARSLRKAEAVNGALACEAMTVPPTPLSSEDKRRAKGSAVAGIEARGLV